MNIESSPFIQIRPVASASTVRTADAIVGPESFTPEMVKALPQGSLMMGVLRLSGVRRKAIRFEVGVNVLTLGQTMGGC